MSERVGIVDGSHMLYAVIAVESCVPGTATASVEFAVFKFMMSLFKSISAHNLTQVVVCWDKGRNWRRDQISDTYKAFKDDFDSLDAEEQARIGLIRESRQFLYDTLPGLGILQYRVDQFEADDLSYFLSREVFSSGILISEDKDWYQHINDSWTQYRPRNDIFMDKAKLIETYDLIPELHREHIITAHALSGDSKGEVFGYKGVAMKKANSKGFLIAKKILQGHALNPKYTAEKAILEDTNRFYTNYQLLDLECLQGFYPFLMLCYQQELLRLRTPNQFDWIRFCNTLKSERLPEQWSYIQKLSNIYPVWRRAA